jgi:hypothetical protein
MISQELRDWVRKRNQDDLKEWIAKKYEDEYKDEFCSSNYDEYYPSKKEIYEWLWIRFHKDWERHQKAWDSQPVEFDEEWLLERHPKDWMQDTSYNQDRKLRYSEKYQEIKREYKETEEQIIKLESQIEVARENIKFKNLNGYSNDYEDRSDYDYRSREVESLRNDLRAIGQKSGKYDKGLSETEILRSIRLKEYISLQKESLPQRRESLPLQRKPFHCDPILYALLIHSNDLSVPRFAFPIHLKILVKGSIVCGRLISERTYTSLMSENLSVIDNFLHCDFNREVSYYGEVSGELYLHLDTDGYKDTDTDPMFRYLRISIHDVDGFSICQFNSLSEDP